MENLIKFSEFLTAIGVDLNQISLDEAISLMKDAEKLVKDRVNQ